MRRAATIILLTSILAMTCSRQVSFPPIGSYSNITLVTETGRLEGITEMLVRELQHPIDYYTKEELQFRVKLMTVYDMEKQPPSKNMILFGLVKQGEIGRMIERFIGTAAVRKVLEGEVQVLKKLNYPVEGQLTVIVTASSGDRLKKVVEDSGEMIRNIIEEANRERLRNYLLQREKVEVSETLRGKYGFVIRVPFLYEVNQERKEVPGVELVRVGPHRGLTISWRSWNREQLSVADSTDLYDIRSDIAWKMYDKDVMRRNLVFFSSDQLGPYSAVRMEGYWENSVDQFGGPFMCFFVYDEVKSRLWIIDCLVYAPGFNKHTLLRELRAVAETFRLG